MGLTTETSNWCESLWTSHVAQSPTAQHTVQDGVHLQPRFGDLCQDIHAALYLPHASTLKNDAPAWATALLTQAHTLAEWKPLRERCARNGFAAGIAAESIVHSLLPLVPKARRDTQHGQHAAAASHPASGDDATTRRMLRQALRAASTELEQAEASCEALSAALGFPGTGDGTPETMQDLARVRTLWALLSANPTLRHIAQMAGRLSRLGAAQKRGELRLGVGAITGITLGGDIPRILPSEFAGLRSTHRLQPLATMETILRKKALQYEQKARTPLARGPIVLCLDESGSMQGDAEQWTKAIALALRCTARKQRRAFWVCGFNARVTHEHRVEHGDLPLDTLLAIVTMRARGGTNFDPPFQRALEVLHTSATMRQADIVVVTDGEGDLSDATAAAVLTAKREQEVHVYVIGIGGAAESLAPLADARFAVSHDPDKESPVIAPVIALTAIQEGQKAYASIPTHNP